GCFCKGDGMSLCPLGDRGGPIFSAPAGRLCRLTDDKLQAMIRFEQGIQAVDAEFTAAKIN
ncbi:MAG: hypothetical protein ACYS71_04475, partial [Planctomycetota bacterium]